MELTAGKSRGSHLKDNWVIESFAETGGKDIYNRSEDLYYLVIVTVLWLKLNSNDLKLFTAVVVALFLAVPYLRGQKKSSFAKLRRKGG